MKTADRCWNLACEYHDEAADGRCSAPTPKAMDDLGCLELEGTNYISKKLIAGMEARGRLHAAAPDLLAACKGVIRYWDYNPPESQLAWHGAKQCRAIIEKAIAKAEKGELK